MKYTFYFRKKILRVLFSNKLLIVQNVTAAADIERSIVHYISITGLSVKQQMVNFSHYFSICNSRRSLLFL